MSTILCDVDGVVADLITRVEQITSLRRVDIKQWDFWQQLSQREHAALSNAMSTYDFWAQLPVVDGALRGINVLEALGHDIAWVTSPWARCDLWYGARLDWLEDAFGGAHDYLPVECKWRVNGDFFIDDKPAHVASWSRSHPDGTAILFDHPYNRDFSWPLRMSWSEICTYFEHGSNQTTSNQ